VDLVIAITMAWFEGELVLYLVYTLSCFHRIAFHHIYLVRPARAVGCHDEEIGMRLI
jgi:hypothetical protein